MALSEQQKQEMKRDVFTIQTQEERQAVQLSKVGEKFSEDQRRLHNVKAAERDVLKINKILNHKEELTLKDEDHMDLVLRQNRNLNFLFMNQEKWSGDSLIMQEIKKTLRSYENLLHEKTNDSKSREELAGTAVAFCDELVSSCEAYLSRGRSFFFWRWGRFEAVNQLKQRMLEEKRLLSNLSTNEWTKSFGHVADGADSLRDLLNEHTIGGRLKKHQEAVKKNKKADEENPEHVLERREKTKEADVTYKSPIALTEEDLKEREEREKADKKKAVKERQENIRKAREKDEENPEHVLERREKTKEADVD
ncbi:hypothetical protein, partial [Butyrivibrio sp. YAB3001]|uniref:hypothetical protein n=1 Tax=Butyrivibrio sp. YAB3001 TaxID=1520812 RepID=UPI0008F63017